MSVRGPSFSRFSYLVTRHPLLVTTFTRSEQRGPSTLLISLLTSHLFLYSSDQLSTSQSSAQWSDEASSVSSSLILSVSPSSVLRSLGEGGSSHSLIVSLPTLPEGMPTAVPCTLYCTTHLSHSHYSLRQFLAATQHLSLDAFVGFDDFVKFIDIA